MFEPAPLLNYTNGYKNRSLGVDKKLASASGNAALYEEIGMDPPRHVDA